MTPDRVGTEQAIKPWTLYSEGQRWRLLAILFLVSTSNYLDRNIISILLEPIKREFHVSDTLLGLLSGVSFALFYATLGLPVARWADRGNRKRIIALALTCWSVMTAACGVVQSYWQLALARIGVGAGEAGAIPPAQSLIADYFPPERRAGAYAIFTAAGMAGYVLGFVAGGQVAVAYGWRMSFLVAGLPGLALAVLVHLGLREPRMAVGFQALGGTQEPLARTVRRLAGKKAYRYVLMGQTLYFVVAYGVLIFVPSFLLRVLGQPLGKVSVLYGTTAAAGSVLGTLGGGFLGNRLGGRDVRWLAWLPAVACVLTYPVLLFGFTLNDLWPFLACGFVTNLLLNAGLPLVYAAIQAVCGAKRRAMAVAVMFFFANLIGFGLGPVLTGAISDALTARWGVGGLRYALMSVSTVLLASSWCFYRCGCAMPNDIEE
ncbi:MAG TPA: MFS transporter [Vicinamibacterales bacterium]|jgi:MFS family permease